MGDTGGMRFGEFRIDLEGRRLLRGGASVSLRPKAWTLLRILVERAGHVVTRNDVARLVWPDVVVGDDSIAKAVRELRAALGDDARTPRYLETVHRVGLRFIGEILRDAVSAAAQPAAAPNSASVIGRASDLATLASRFQNATRGARQFVFVAGEGGIGKSTLLRTFLDSLGSDRDAPRLLFAQSAEGLALAEAYAPLLDAIETLRRFERGPAIDMLLQRHAPQWLAQLPGGAAQVAGSQRVPASRMLREGLSFLEALAEESPVVVALEDAHAADIATLDLLAMLAARPGPARILVVVTFRRSEAIAARHPVASMSAELELKGFATSIAVGPLDSGDVRRVLEARLGPMQDAARLAELLLVRSGGNPLFLTALIDHLVASGAVLEDEGCWQLARPLSDLADVVPDHLRSLVDALLAPLPPDVVEVLEGAAVAGLEFDARAVAAALECDLARVEDACDRLVSEGRLLRFVEEVRWNDGTRSACYAFLHQLYEGALYARISPSRRRRLHLRVAERVESGTVAAAARLSSELASHFLRGGNEAKAISYLLKSAERANRRGAHRDAAAMLRRALSLHDSSPIDDRQAMRFLRTKLLLVGTIGLANGFVDQEIETLLEGARPIAERLGAVPIGFMIEFGVYVVQLCQSRLEAARESAQRMIVLADAAGLPPLIGAAILSEGWPLLYLGDFVAARERFSKALEFDLDTAAFDAIGTMGALPDLRTFSLCGQAQANAILGDRDAALAAEAEALEGAAATRPNDRMVALMQCSLLRAILGDDAVAHSYADDALRLVDENGENPPWNLAAGVMASISAVKPDVVAMKRELSAFETAGYRLAAVAFRTIGASRLCRHDDARGARELIDDPAFPTTTVLDPAWAAEQYRVRAELMAMEGSDAERTDSLFRSAVRMASQQKARLWEERAMDSAAGKAATGPAGRMGRVV